MKLGTQKTFSLLIGLFLFFATQGHAQCVVNPPSNTPGFYPNPMPYGCVGTLYSQEVQFVFPLDTTVTVPPFGTFTIPFDSFHVDAILNVPAGLSLTQNAPNGKYYPNGGVSARGCGDVLGIPTTANLAIDSVTIVITAWATAPIVGVQAGQDTMRVSLRIFDTPSSTFTFAGSGNNRSFTHTGAGANSWFWDFGDGNTSIQQNPTHTFPGQGVYTTCLVTSNGNCSDTVCQTVTIGCPPPPVAYSVTTGGLVASFTDNTPGTPVGWLWDFGDGNIGTQQNPTHTYAVAGTYTVCLTVTDTCGTDSACQSVTVCPNPVAGFTSAINFLGVSFSDNTPGSPISWLWDFGDGNSSTQQNPNHTYANAGTYNICLTVTDACGTDSSCSTLQVCEELVADFQFNIGAAGLSYDFSDASSGTAIAWAWDFGDGATSTQQNPAHTYANDGSVTVCLIVVDDCGEADTTCQTILITSLIEPFGSWPITVFPNPAQDQLSILAETYPGKITLQISDLAGKAAIPTRTVETNGKLATQLDISGLPAGLYFLTIGNNGMVKTVRFVKE